MDKNVRVAITSSNVKKGEKATLFYISNYTSQSARYEKAEVVVEDVTYARCYGFMRIETNDTVYYAPYHNPYCDQATLGYAIIAKPGSRIETNVLELKNGKVSANTRYSKGILKEMENVDKQFVKFKTDCNEDFFLECPPGFRVVVPGLTLI